MAAGAGTRFGPGHEKLLTQWRGRALIEHVLAALRLATDEGLLREVMVVHSPETPRIADLARQAGFDATMVTRSRPAISESILAGMVSMEATYDLTGTTAAMLFLGDQPLVSVETIRALAQASVPAALVRPRYAETPTTPGHPVLLGRDHWQSARALEGDRGFRGLQWTLLDVPGSNPDVDTPADLADLDA